MQYDKHVGDDVEVLTKDGRKLYGQLVDVQDEAFSIDTEVMVAVEEKKRKQKEIQTLTFGYGDVKYTRYDLKVSQRETRQCARLYDLDKMLIKRRDIWRLYKWEIGWC